MPLSKLDTISPAFIGASRIALNKANPDADVFVRQPFRVLVGYSGAGVGGVSLPLVVEVISPRGRRRTSEFTRSAPATLIITPEERGLHLLVLREKYHNRWFGSLEFDAIGDDLSTPRATAQRRNV